MAPLNTYTAQPVDSAEADTDTEQSPRKAARHRKVRFRSAPSSRVAYALGVATVCSLALVNLLSGEEAANATADSPSVAVAAALGIDGSGIDEPAMEEPQLLDQLAASRSERDAEQAAAAASQAQAEEAAAAAKAEAERKAAEEAAAAAAAAEAAAAQASAAAAAPAAPAASVAASVIAKINNSAGPIKAVAQNAANAVVSNVPGAAGMTIGGTRASAADPGGHPSGLALDYMCSPSLGDAIAQYHIAHWDELGVEYIIWQQRMLSSPGGSWKPMEDRGSATANHYDHVHVNYRG
ncbi:hypothetical protein ACI78T_03415 [Blastococcus sp. SYSU D00922]